MAKFQVKYPLQLDLEATRERSRKLKSLVSSVQYCNETDSQLRIELRGLEATVLVSPKTVQVYWTGEYKKIEKVESILLQILDPTPISSLGSIRVDVPSIGLAVKETELRTLLEISQEKIRQMGLTIPKSDSETNTPDMEQEIRRSKKLLSIP